MLKERGISNTNPLLFRKYNETQLSICLCYQRSSNESCFQSLALTDLAKGQSPPGLGPRKAACQWKVPAVQHFPHWCLYGQ